MSLPDFTMALRGSPSSMRDGQLQRLDSVARTSAFAVAAAACRGGGWAGCPLPPLAAPADARPRICAPCATGAADESAGRRIRPPKLSRSFEAN